MLPSPLPDDPRKWDGWNHYNSENFYERLCLDFASNPTNEQIEDHSRQLQVWWQKKLPLKNQPSNPLAQLLRVGIDHAPRHLAEARAELLNSQRRGSIDATLRARLREGALTEFQKFLDFALSDQVLTSEEEANLRKLAKGLNLTEEDAARAIEAGLRQTGAKREIHAPSVEPSPLPGPASVPEPVPVPTPATPSETEQEPVAVANHHTGTSSTNGHTTARVDPTGRPRRQRTQTPAEQFRHMLGLSGLDGDSMSDDRRDTFIDMAENMGLDPGEAEDMVDEYLDGVEAGTIPLAPRGGADAPVTAAPRAGAKVSTVVPVTANVPFKKVAKPEGIRLSPGGAAKLGTVISANVRPVAEVLDPEEERRRNPNFLTSLGTTMLFVPGATFTMGNASPTAPANEQPTTRVTLCRFFISRFPVTNAEYERYDLAHASRRGAWADDSHPVIYVSNVDATKFCQWLSGRDKRRYRLPTEAEWEYAAKGTEARTFPWGEAAGRGDLANYADANTTFAWADATVDDGYAETSPVGVYPAGASAFGVEDMAGNVWEWCLDDYDAYKGGERANPRVVKAGGQRVYRGGSWKSRFASLKSTARGYNLPTYASNDVGFRVVCECD